MEWRERERVDHKGTLSSVEEERKTDKTGTDRKDTAPFEWHSLTPFDNVELHWAWLMYMGTRAPSRMAFWRASLRSDAFLILARVAECVALGKGCCCAAETCDLQCVNRMARCAILTIISSKASSSLESRRRCGDRVN